MLKGHTEYIIRIGCVECDNTREYKIVAPNVRDAYIYMSKIDNYKCDCGCMMINIPARFVETTQVDALFAPFKRK
jgi:hypothetical protein